jgi:hypothetical protein
VLIKTADDGKPFIKPSTELKFSFYMALQQPTFMTVSNLELNELASKRFYFTNLHQNKVTVSPGNQVFYLTKQVAAYDAAANYLPGDLVKRNSIIYEAIKASVNITPPDATNWIRRDKNQYAAKPDLLRFITNQSNFSLNPVAADVAVSFYKLNIATGVFDIQVFMQTLHFESPVDEISIDLAALPNGKYRVVLNGSESFAYLSSEAVYNNVFGIIDLYNHLPDGNDFSFFDADGKVKDQQDTNGKNVWLTYRIRFANRVAFWRYAIPKKGVKAFENHPDYTFNGNSAPLPSDAFISNLPIPLQERPYDFKLTLFNPVSSEPPLAANPDVHTSGMLTKVGADYFCNIYLNY